MLTRTALVYFPLYTAPDMEPYYIYYSLHDRPRSWI